MMSVPVLREQPQQQLVNWGRLVPHMTAIDPINLVTSCGTDEGRIGTVDALHSRPVPAMWDHKHRGAVYNLAWGPNLKPPHGVREGSSKFDVRSIVCDNV